VASLSSSSRDAPAPPSTGLDDAALLRALRDGDESAFARLVDAWSPAMLRMALVHVRGRAVAEEVVQEAWLTVLRDLDRFQHRSSLRTWVLGIVANMARSRARAERRCTPMDLGSANTTPLFAPSRFRPPADPWPHHWATGPTPWPTPEQELLAGETRRVILAAIAALPPAQREVLVLRDLEGASAQETCNVLGLGDTNQRVLLHRARSRVRKEIENYFGATEPT
jgi:RNA polymerase sigma-70 factor (ECF subfamily)